MRKNNRNTKEVSYLDRTIAHEKLPFPIVHYPGHYGTFFGFQHIDNGTIYLCSCAKEAVENYIKIKTLENKSIYLDYRKMFIISSNDFPVALVEYLINNNYNNNESVLNHLVYEDRLCHQCNNGIPTYRYCHEMYGGSFKQTYGWYINKQALEYGLTKGISNVITDICPREVLDLITLDLQRTPILFQELMKVDRDKADLLWRRFQAQKRGILKVIENEVRMKFGHKKIGEGWTSETILYYIVQKCYPDFKIHRHYRPDYLKGLELDIFIEDLNLGIEYQGIQHYKPVKHWGGVNAFNKQRKRDLLKKEICESLNIGLLYIKYDENLSSDYVMAKINQFL